MVLIRVTADNVKEFIGALGIATEEYIKGNKTKQLYYTKACPLYTGKYSDNSMSLEMLCKKNCKLRDMVLGDSPQSDSYLNCCATYRLTNIANGGKLTLYLCESILDVEVGDI